MYTDKIIICRDCGEEFVFTAGEQEFYAEHGLDSEPVRCRACRSRRKHGVGQKPKRVLYEIVCSKCGEVEAIPFEPRHDRPVFCNACYRKMNEK
ncbi:MAG: zinc-ribbon domain containing protein [Candidatus Ornithomonoglobus sp.]